MTDGKTASFQSLVANLAACGGELLRQMTVEHEREVKNLRSEINIMRGHIAQFSGTTPAEVRTKIRAEVRREERKTRSSKPDENALAKAFAFVDSIGDTITEERSYLASIPERDMQSTDTSRVLDVAADLMDYVRQSESRELSRENSSGTAAPPLERRPGDVRDVQARGPQLPQPLRREYAQVQMPSAAGADVPGYGSPLRDTSGQLRIKLTGVSPPIKAPAPDAPEPMHDDEDDPDDVMREQPPASSQRRPPPNSFSDTATASVAVEVAAQIMEDAGIEPRSPDCPTLAEDVPLATPRADHDLAAENSTCNLELADANAIGELDLAPFDRAPSAPLVNPMASSSPLLSRETTTWREGTGDLMSRVDMASGSQEPERQRMFELQSETELTPAAEAGGSISSQRSEVPSEDWRSLLQVHGTKWRPSGDDGVSIAMYLDAPAPASPEKVYTPADTVTTPTSI